MFQKRIFSAFVIPLAAFFTLQAFGDQNSPALEDAAALVTHFEKDGEWHRVAEGLWERQLSGNAIERYAIGREGLVSVVEEMEERTFGLLEEYVSSPSADLWERIQIHVEALGPLKRAERETVIPSLQTKSSCFPYSASASVSHNPGSWVYANASWTSDDGGSTTCPGEVYTNASTGRYCPVGPCYDYGVEGSCSTQCLATGCYAEAIAWVYVPSLQIYKERYLFDYDCGGGGPGGPGGPD